MNIIKTYFGAVQSPVMAIQRATDVPGADDEQDQMILVPVDDGVVVINVDSLELVVIEIAQSIAHEISKQYAESRPTLLGRLFNRLFNTKLKHGGLWNSVIRRSYLLKSDNTTGKVNSNQMTRAVNKIINVAIDNREFDRWLIQTANSFHVYGVFLTKKSIRGIIDDIQLQLYRDNK